MAKPVNGDDKEEKIAKEFMTLMPELPRMFSRLFKRVALFDHREPARFILETKAEVQKCVQTLEARENDVLGGFSNLLADLPLKQVAGSIFAELTQIAKSEASKDQRYSLLLKLMSQADMKVSLISIIVPMRHADPIETLEPQCRPYDLLEQAARERGEVRATAVLRAFAETVEALYRPYLITVWALSFFKDGEVPPQQIPASGNLVKEAYLRLSDYPGLIEPDAIWMRNSAIHNPRRYMFYEDAVEMWDKNVEARSVSVDDLHAMVKRMYQISGVTIQRVGQLYMFRQVAETGLLDTLTELFPKVLSTNAEEIGKAEERLAAKAQEIFRPMAEFFEAKSPSIAT